MQQLGSTKWRTDWVTHYGQPGKKKKEQFLCRVQLLPSGHFSLPRNQEVLVCFHIFRQVARKSGLVDPWLYRPYEVVFLGHTLVKSGLQLTGHSQTVEIPHLFGGNKDNLLRMLSFALKYFVLKKHPIYNFFKNPPLEQIGIWVWSSIRSWLKSRIVWGEKLSSFIMFSFL